MAGTVGFLSSGKYIMEKEKESILRRAKSIS